MKRAVAWTAAIALTLAGVAMTAPEGSAVPRPLHLGAAGVQDANGGWRWTECRFKNVGTPRWSSRDVERTIRCVSAREEPPGGVAKVLDVWACESRFAVESPHSDPYHGPFQYLRSTFEAQQRSMPAVVQRYDLRRRVHNVRANITTAIAWAGRHGWAPWACG